MGYDLLVTGETFENQQSYFYHELEQFVPVRIDQAMNTDDEILLVRLEILLRSSRSLSPRGSRKLIRLKDERFEEETEGVYYNMLESALHNLGRR